MTPNPKTTYSSFNNSSPEVKRVNEKKQLNLIQHPVSLLYLKYTRQRQQSVMMLQHCAILSQLNRHYDALDISKATALLIKEITYTACMIVQSKKENLAEKEKNDVF